MLSALLPTVRRLRADALHLADASGINRALRRSRWRRDRLLILCYHGVSIADEHEWADLYVSPEHLTRRLELLDRAGATILPLDDALQRLSVGELPPAAVSLTFDDGAFDFSAKAMPILAAANAPATLYLTTYYCGRNQPVFDTMSSYLLWKARGRTIRLPELGEVVTIPASTADPAFGAIHLAFRRHALNAGYDADAKDALARALAAVVGEDYDRLLDSRILQLMNHDEVAALDRRLVDVQLHTHRHRTPRDAEGFARELRDNAAIIRRLRGPDTALEHFCYPSGDHVPQYAQWLAEAGVSWATTCDAGLATRSSHPHFLPRVVDTQPMPDHTFQAWVSGLGMFAFARRSIAPQRL